MRQMQETEEESESFLQHVAQHKMFLKLRHKFKALDDWALELENRSRAGSSAAGSTNGDDDKSHDADTVSRDADRASRDMNNKSRDSVTQPKSELGAVQNSSKVNLISPEKCSPEADDMKDNSDNSELDKHDGVVNIAYTLGLNMPHVPPIRYTTPDGSSNSLTLDRVHSDREEDHWVSL